MLGSERTIGDTIWRTNRATYLLNIPSTGEPSTIIRPLTFDVPQEQSSQTATDQTLSEIVGSEYIIKRILGSIIVCLGQNVVNEDPDLVGPANAYEVAAGFFVARAGDSGDPTEAAFDAPIGVAGASELPVFSNYSPLATDTIREPWMWRRSWALSPKFWSDNPAGNDTTIRPESLFPYANWQYNQLNLGPTVDIKSRRKVTSDDRLWLAVGARWFVRDEEESTPAPIVITHDLRLFGSLRKAQNTGNF